MPDTRDRDRSPRGRRPGGGGGPSNPSRRAPVERRVFVSNMPFDTKWQEVKDMFRNNVGDVTYVELFNDENGRSRGCGILEFATEDMANKAVDKMHRHEFRGRKLVVKEDFETDRDEFGKIVRGGERRGGGDRGDREHHHHRDAAPGFNGDYGNTYGLSADFLKSLNIESPLHTRIFVANLGYDIDDKKLREVFRLAGRVISSELNRDPDGKSRGHGVVEYTHPVEAVQAISMFNNQKLYDRRMIVRFDNFRSPDSDQDQLPNRLPEGLEGVGMGLGSGGNPLTNVAQNLPSAQQNNANNAFGNTGPINPVGAMGGAGNMGGMSGGMGDMAANLQNFAAIARQLNMTNMLAGLGGAGAAAGGNPAAAAAGAGGMNQNLVANLLGAAAGGGAGVGAGLAAANIGGSGSVGAAGNLGTAAGNSGMASSGMGGGDMGRSGAMSDMGRSDAMSDLGRSGGMGGDIGRSSNMGYSSTSGGGSRDIGGGSRDIGGSSRDMGGSAATSYGHTSGGGGGGSSSQLGSDTVVVRNLPIECNWQSLREGFSHCGEIQYAEMKDRGTGLIRFHTEREALRAVDTMDKQLISGRPIDVRLY